MAVARLHNYLRGTLAYQGVIFSDDLGMHAAKSVGSLEARVHKCLAAGCDLVLVCRPKDVEELLAGTEGPIGDASRAVNTLYGKPTLSREELVAVNEAGIRELRQWQASLQDL